MFDIKLLKLKKGISKNGKDYYQATILVGNEIINTFILKYQYEAILSSLSDEEKKIIVVNR